MPIDIGPVAFQEAVERGFKRTERARRARLLFLRAYCGHYYDAEKGDIGTEPLNLIFNAIRVLVPNLVFNNPEFKVTTDYLAYRDYAELAGLALTQQAKQINLKATLRAGIVDALFTMGIAKTGLCDSSTAIRFDENDSIDPGEVYTELVDFNNFVWDPSARHIDQGLFQGDRIAVPRASLLESGLYDNEIIERLPPAFSGADKNDRSERLSARAIDLEEAGKIEDLVEIVELWVPRANAIVTVPAGTDFKPESYLRVADYYGPDAGPYSKLLLTPPVPNNPLPISSVGIWFDLHKRANEMAVKVIDQAGRQKDILAYRSSAADDVEMLRDAEDGDAIAVDDPSAINLMSFGGQRGSNEQHLNSLQSWFNMMSGNTEGLAGVGMNAKSATEAQYLQGNAQVTLSDMQEAVYAWTAEIGRKHLWYLHTDPLMQVPLTRRQKLPPQVVMGPAGPQILPGREEDVQVVLTPEMRRGDAIDYALETVPESMGRSDSTQEYQKALEFAVKVIPSAATAAMTCAQMGIPFSFPRFVTLMAKQAGIKWMDEVFQDPEFQMKSMMQMMAGPQLGDAKGQMVPPGGGAAGVMQNGGSPMAGRVPGAQERQRSEAQEGSNRGQAALGVREV